MHKEIELELVLETINRVYGYDFREYAKASLRRRFNLMLETEGLQHYSELIPRLIHEPELFNQLLAKLSITVTEMFRNPEFFENFRKKVIPILKTYPFVKIWHAGCATGQEVYSMAILLEEEGLLEKTQIFGTDYNKNALEIAREGIYSDEDVDNYEKNYNKSGKKSDFKSYFYSKYGMSQIDKRFSRNISFHYHNLTTDGVFSEFNVVLCRNVMIYFDQNLQDKALDLYTESLVPGGILCLGDRETLDFTGVVDKYDTLSKETKIYKKKGAL